MTSDFATTVAAVAPVILLVGVVEMRAYGQALRTQHETTLEALEALWAERAEESDEERRSAIQSRWRRLHLRALRATALPMLLSVLWVITTGLLAIATYRSLSYLAQDQPGTSPAAANEILSTIKLGLIMLVATPMATWFNAYFAIPIQSLRKAWSDSRTRHRHDEDH